MAYNSAYTGSQIDQAVGAVREKEGTWDSKQDELVGTEDQIVGFNSAGEAVAVPPPDTGVTTFNGRTGAVTPQSGDYTADMVGARPNTWTPTAADVGALTQSQADARYLQLSGGTIEVPAIENGSPSVALRLRNTGNSSSANRHYGPYFEFETPDGEIVREYIKFDDGHAVVSFYDAENDDFVALSGLLDPVNGADAATKYYVDSKLPKPATVTLTAAGWSNNQQTATVNGVSATETAQLIQPMPAVASQQAYMAAGIYCSGQAANSLTFTCSTVPTQDITVYVTIQEVRL